MWIEWGIRPLKSIKYYLAVFRVVFKFTMTGWVFLDIPFKTESLPIATLYTANGWTFKALLYGRAIGSLLSVIASGFWWCFRECYGFWNSRRILANPNTWTLEPFSVSNEESLVLLISFQMGNRYIFVLLFYYYCCYGIQSKEHY